MQTSRKEIIKVFVGVEFESANEKYRIKKENSLFLRRHFQENRIFQCVSLEVAFTSFFYLHSYEFRIIIFR